MPAVRIAVRLPPSMIASNRPVLASNNWTMPTWLPNGLPGGWAYLATVFTPNNGGSAMYPGITANFPGASGIGMNCRNGKTVWCFDT
jgi:hypothetical protein